MHFQSSYRFLAAALAVAPTALAQGGPAKTCSWVGLPDLSRVIQQHPDQNNGVDTGDFDVSRYSRVKGSVGLTVANDLLAHFGDVGTPETCSLAFNFESDDQPYQATGATEVSVYNTGFNGDFSKGFTWNNAPASTKLVGSVKFPPTSKWVEQVVGNVDCNAKTFRITMTDDSAVGEINFSERYNWGLRLYAC